jgi:drug/metabolite transporter (DMT)-like permease
VSAIAYVPFFLTALLVQIVNLKSDKDALWNNRWLILIFLLSGVTSPLWYVITKKQSVLIGSIYEIKYIVVMALLYIFLGQSRVTLNTAIGLCFAITSVYFISRK